MASKQTLSQELLRASEDGRTEAVVTLLSGGADPNYKGGWRERTALHYASWKGHLKVVQLLISLPDVDVNAPDQDGWTPLHWACWRGHLEVVRHLVSQPDVDVNAADQDGWIPLHWACWKGHLEVVRHLVSLPDVDVNATDQEGWTPLHRACWFGRTKVVKYLLREGHCNVNAADNLGRTPLAVASSQDPAVIRELLRHGAHASSIYKHYSKQLPEGCPRKPTESSVKVFIVGKQGMGKSTLTTALKKEGSIMTYVMKRVRQVSGIEFNTAGIIPHDIQSKTFGCATIYDFAGHEEFYSSHDVMLRSSVADSPAVFLLVANLSLSDEEFRQSILSWLAFLENQGVPDDPKPHIIIVGSHADEVTSAEAQNKETIVNSLPFSSFHFAGFVPIDCRYAESFSMTKLRKQLSESCSALRHKTEISVNCHCLYLYLLDKFQTVPAIKVEEALSKIQEESGKSQSSESGILSCIPDDPAHLYKLLQDLHERGNVLLLGDTENLKNSWIILDKETILFHITGTVFAPNPADFKKCMNIATSTGVVPFSKISGSFPNLDSNMIVEFLCHFEFCHEVVDTEGQQLLQAATAQITSNAITSPGDVEISDSSPVTGERFFFFPHLLQIDVPGTVWEPSDEFTYHCGWILECSDPDKFLTHRFLHVLLLRLAFAFALAPDADSRRSHHLAIQRKCSIWKNGIHWGDRSGTEALVEVVDARKRVNVMLRCSRGKALDCVRLRSSLIRKIVSAKNELCSGVPTNELFVHPSDAASYPLKSMMHLKLVSCTELATAITEGNDSIVSQSGRTMDLDMLLYFEPYAHLGERTMQQLFDEENKVEPKKIISDNFIHRLAESTHQTNTFIHLFKPSRSLILERLNQVCPGPTHVLVEVLKMWRDGSKHNYQSLHEKLDQFSVFAGRNPLNMAGPKSPCLQEVLSLHPDQQSSEELQVSPQRAGLEQYSVSDGIHPLNTAGEKSPSFQEASSSHPLSLGEVDQTTLDINILSAVNSALVSVAPRWMDLGVSLGLDSPTIELIHSNHPKDASRCLTEVLAKWLQQVRIARSWRAITLALMSPSVNRSGLAHSIALSHGIGTPQECETRYQDVNSERLAVSDLGKVLDTIFTVQDWFHLGLSLNISYHRLIIIEADNPQDTHRCRTEMLTAWLKGLGGESSWRQLARALDSPLIQRTEIATMIATQHRV